MEAGYYYWIVLFILTLTTQPTIIGGSQTEYCVFETFTAECEEGHIIAINEAKYGRMSKSRCITEDDTIGCYADALPYIDKACSGKQSCEFAAVMDQDLYKAYKTKCKRDRESYLEVQYECIEVFKGDPRGCARPNGIVLDIPEAYISNELFTQNHPSTQCPMRINALPGQTINVQLINFIPQDGVANCHTFGYLAEPYVKYNESVCLSPKRQRHLYTSSGNTIEILINTQKVHQVQSRFLIHYEVEGCANLVAPEHAWSKRVDNTVKVGCLHKNMTWHLTCHNNRWLGVVGSCNSSKDSADQLPTPTDQSFIFDGLSLKTIIIIAIGVLFIILVCMAAICVKCLCFNQSSMKQRSGPHFNDNSLDRNYGYASQKLAKRSSWLYTFKKEKPERQHIWESPLPTPKIPHDGNQENIHPFVNKKECYDSTKLSRECLSECGEYMAPVKVREKQMTKSMDSLPQRGCPEGDEYTAPMNKDLDASKAEAIIENVAEYTVPENIRNEQKDSGVEYTSPSNLRFSSNADDLFPPPQTEEELGEIDITHKKEVNDSHINKGIHCGPHGTQYELDNVLNEHSANDNEDDEYMLPTNMR